MSAPRKPHPIESLSFVVDLAPNSRRNVQRCFWNVQPTDDYADDCRTGTVMAIEYMAFELSKEAGGGDLLG